MTTHQYKDRPLCETPGCGKSAAVIKDHHNGYANYRRWCSSCHNTKTAAKHGLKNISQVVAKNAGFNSEYEYKEYLAKEKGFSNLQDYVNSWHPYRRYRKNYCENIDGRLGFVCTTNVIWNGMLDVDHIDGNPTNNNPENLQTLCKCCHAYKTNEEEDYLTPGRSTLGVTY
jgi:5-methylcytosine-specific restriction endonuclease McrA